MTNFGILGIFYTRPLDRSGPNLAP